MKNEATIREILNLLVTENLVAFNDANYISKEIANNNIVVYNDMADFEQDTKDRNKDKEVIITPVFNTFNTTHGKRIKARLYQVDYIANVDKEFEEEVECDCGCHNCTHTDTVFYTKKVDVAKKVYVRKLAETN